MDVSQRGSRGRVREDPEGNGPAERSDDEGDFAEEHTSMTLATEMDGGPEGMREPESPEGRGGDGGMD
ncbi:hypothetical protein [Phytoactinopolyspora halophila]|uniref:hypothetical protein n=1 Tax=Phytoactinopolyspora halophila TaxID=1981511 RepID=UPI000F4F3058|nr:hypothetical protein [Phytoactinopolyspora halophila]